MAVHLATTIGVLHAAHPMKKMIISFNALHQLDGSGGVISFSQFSNPLILSLIPSSLISSAKAYFASSKTASLAQPCTPLATNDFSNNNDLLAGTIYFVERFRKNGNTSSNNTALNKIENEQQTTTVDD
jgi:hypothetical protein